MSENMYSNKNNLVVGLPIGSCTAFSGKLAEAVAQDSEAHPVPSLSFQTIALFIIL